MSEKIVVYTYGVFDLLHPGHLRLFEKCKRLGEDVDVIVGVVKDEEIKAKKDPRKPVIPFDDRIEQLSCLKTVWKVMGQETYDPVPNLKSLKEEGVKVKFLVKGDDRFEIYGEDYIKGEGGEFVFTPYEEGFSTTDIIEKILKDFKDGNV